MSKFFSAVKSFVREEEGAGILEYVLLIVFIALVAVAAINAFGTNLRDMFQSTADSIDSTAPTSLPTPGA